MVGYKHIFEKMICIYGLIRIRLLKLKSSLQNKAIKDVCHINSKFISKVTPLKYSETLMNLMTSN